MPMKTNDIAIIGMAGRFPGARNVDELYQLLATGKDAVTKIPDARLRDTTLPPDEIYKSCGYLENVDKFDHSLFNISKAEADAMDPRQRLLLEIVYETIENAGYAINDLDGSRSSVFVGDIQLNYYKLAEEMTPTLATGNSKGFTAARISRQFNLTGSTFTIDSSCASSLVAVHLACNELILGDADYALACGVNIDLYPFADDTIGLDIDSPDGKSRAFSEETKGMSQGELVACVLLKPLHKAIEDGDIIHAVIAGSAVNHNASRSASLTAPDSIAQAEVIMHAWKKASIVPSQLGFIEAHGSGTKLGDSIEIGGLNLAFREFSSEKHLCPISTIKSNIGHGKSAAGIAGLIKAVLSIKNKVIFPNINFETPSTLIDFGTASVYVNTSLKKWSISDDQVRYAGISSMGLSGTNCHLVLREAEERIAAADSNEDFIVAISSLHKDGVSQYAQSLLEFMNRKTDCTLADLAYTLTAGRKQHYSRAAFVAKSMSELQHKVSEFINNSSAQPVSLNRPNKLIFLFTDFNNSGLPTDILGQFQRFEVFNSSYNHYLQLKPEDPHFRFICFQLAFYSLLESLGVSSRYVLGVGLGKITTKILTREVDINKAYELACSFDTHEMPDLEDRAQQLVDREAANLEVTFLNVGCSTLLIDVLAQKVSGKENFHILDLSTHANSLHETIAALFVLGFNINWKKAHTNKGRRIELPGYPFLKKRCWIRDTPKKRPNEKSATVLPTKSDTNLKSTLILKESANWIEKMIAQCWAEVLYLSEISLDDNFFELGGNSILTTKVINSLNATLDANLSFEDVFDFPTIKTFAQYAIKQTDICPVIIKVWKDVLGEPNIKSDTNFFEMGGHSLIANQIINRLEGLFSVSIDFDKFFVHPTPELLKKYIGESLQGKGQSSNFVSVPPIQEAAYYEVSGTQKRLWLISQMQKGSIAYNEPGVYEVTGQLDISALEKAFKSIIARHEILRTSFTMKEGMPVQKVHTVDQTKFSLPVEDLVGRELTSEVIDNLVNENAWTLFDLEQPGLLRIKLLNVSSDRFILLFTVHHIIFDVWSMGVLIHDLQQLYEGYASDQPVNLKPLAIQFKDYASWHNNRLKSGAFSEHEQYWLDEFSGDLPVMNFPYDFPKTSKSYNGKKAYYNFGIQLQQELQMLSNKTEVSLFMTLLGCINVLLYQNTKNSDIILGTPIACRNHADLENQIGCYVNTLPLRFKFASNCTFLQLLSVIRDKTLFAFKYQEYPLDALIEKLELTSDGQQNPLFDIMVVLQNIDSVPEKVTMGSATIRPYKFDFTTSKYDLIFTFSESKKGLVASIEYRVDLFQDQTISLLFQRLESIMNSITKQPDGIIHQLNTTGKKESARSFQFDFD
jgi:3-oxoacyl-(acyl-carrier-protein) synthase/acyl carrier protein